MRSLLSLIPENRVGDRLYSDILFVITHKRTPTDRPVFNDVIYKIKTTDEILDPMRVFVSDKEFVKLYVKGLVGDQYNVPTIDVIRSAEAVNDYEFPSDCCIKPTHLCKEVILRRGNHQIDKNRLKSWFDINYYRSGREANYKTLKPKIIIEPLIFDSVSPADYKFFCVNGAPKLIEVDVDRYQDHKRKFFDADWNKQDFSIQHPQYDLLIKKPDNFSEMLYVATQLSSAFSFIRIDLYSDGKNILVGEITNCSQNACADFIPKSAEISVSRLLFSQTKTASALNKAG